MNDAKTCVITPSVNGKPSLLHEELAGLVKATGLAGVGANNSEINKYATELYKKITSSNFRGLIYGQNTRLHDDEAIIRINYDTSEPDLLDIINFVSSLGPTNGLFSDNNKVSNQPSLSDFKFFNLNVYERYLKGVYEGDYSEDQYGELFEKLTRFERSDAKQIFSLQLTKGQNGGITVSLVRAKKDKGIVERCQYIWTDYFLDKLCNFFNIENTDVKKSSIKDIIQNLSVKYFGTGDNSVIKIFQAFSLLGRISSNSPDIKDPFKSVDLITKEIKTNDNEREFVIDFFSKLLDDILDYKNDFYFIKNNDSHVDRIRKINDRSDIDSFKKQVIQEIRDYIYNPKNKNIFSSLVGPKSYAKELMSITAAISPEKMLEFAHEVDNEVTFRSQSKRSDSPLFYTLFSHCCRKRYFDIIYDQTVTAQEYNMDELLQENKNAIVYDDKNNETYIKVPIIKDEDHIVDIVDGANFKYRLEEKSENYYTLKIDGNRHPDTIKIYYSPKKVNKTSIGKIYGERKAAKDNTTKPLAEQIYIVAEESQRTLEARRVSIEYQGSTVDGLFNELSAAQERIIANKFLFTRVGFDEYMSDRKERNTMKSYYNPISSKYLNQQQFAFESMIGSIDDSISAMQTVENIINTMRMEILDFHNIKQVHDYAKKLMLLRSYVESLQSFFSFGEDIKEWLTNFLDEEQAKSEKDRLYTDEQMDSFKEMTKTLNDNFVLLRNKCNIFLDFKSNKDYLESALTEPMGFSEDQGIFYRTDEKMSSFWDLAVPLNYLICKDYYEDGVVFRRKNGQVCTLEDALRFYDTDINFLQRWCHSISNTPDDLLKIYDQIVKEQKSIARQEIHDDMMNLNDQYKNLTNHDQRIGLFMIEHNEKGNPYIDHFYNHLHIIKDVDYDKFYATYNADREARYNELTLRASQGESIDFATEMYDFYIEWMTENAEVRFGAERPMQDKYATDDFKKLTSEQKDFYNKWMSIKAKYDRYIGLSPNSVYTCPAVRKSSSEHVWRKRLLTGNNINRLRNYFKNSFTVDEDDTEVGSFTQNGNSVTLNREIPTFYRKAHYQELPELYSVDLHYILRMYGMSSLNYKRLSHIKDSIEVAKDVYSERRSINNQVPKSKNASATLNGLARSMSSNTNDLTKAKGRNDVSRFEDFIDQQIYLQGMHKNGTSAWFYKLCQYIEKAFAIVTLQINPVSAITNVLQGVHMIKMEAFSGQYMNLADMARAKGEFYKAIFLMLAKPGYPESISKASLMIQKFNLSQEIDKTMMYGWKTGTPKNLRWLAMMNPSFLLQHIGDYFMSVVPGLGILIHTRVTINENGQLKEISLYDAYEKVKEDGSDTYVLRLKENVVDWVDETVNVARDDNNNPQVNDSRINNNVAIGGHGYNINVDNNSIYTTKKRRRIVSNEELTRRSIERLASEQDRAEVESETKDSSLKYGRYSRSKVRAIRDPYKVDIYDKSLLKRGFNGLYSNQTAKDEIDENDPDNVLVPEIAEWELVNKISRRSAKVLHYLHGIYNEDDKCELSRSSLGRLAIMYRKFIPPILQRRIKNRNYDFDLMEETNGMWRFWIQGLSKAEITQYVNNKKLKKQLLEEGVLSGYFKWLYLTASRDDQRGIIRGVMNILMYAMYNILMDYLFVNGGGDPPKSDTFIWNNENIFKLFSDVFKGEKSFNEAFDLMKNPNWGNTMALLLLARARNEAGQWELFCTLFKGIAAFIPSSPQRDIIFNAFSAFMPADILTILNSPTVSFSFFNNLVGTLSGLLDTSDGYLNIDDELSHPKKPWVLLNGGEQMKMKKALDTLNEVGKPVIYKEDEDDDDEEGIIVTSENVDEYYDFLKDDQKNNINGTAKLMHLNLLEKSHYIGTFWDSDIIKITGLNPLRIVRNPKTQETYMINSVDKSLKHTKQLLTLDWKRMTKDEGNSGVLKSLGWSEKSWNDLDPLDRAAYIDIADKTGVLWKKEIYLLLIAQNKQYAIMLSSKEGSDEYENAKDLYFAFTEKLDDALDKTVTSYNNNHENHLSFDYDFEISGDSNDPTRAYYNFMYKPGSEKKKIRLLFNDLNKKHIDLTSYMNAGMNNSESSELAKSQIPIWKGSALNEPDE